MWSLQDVSNRKDTLHVATSESSNQATFTEQAITCTKLKVHVRIYMYNCN